MTNLRVDETAVREVATAYLDGSDRPDSLDAAFRGEGLGQRMIAGRRPWC